MNEDQQNDHQQPCKKPRMEEAISEHATAMKVAGFSLSAIEEMKNHVDSNKNENSLGQQLREFQVLDEVGSGTEESDGSDQDGDSSDLDFDDDELDTLLDEGLPEDLKGRQKPKYEERYKTVLEEKGHNHFEVLPEGWLQVTHNSGMPLFLHKQSRVCCVAKPYFLGPGSVRKHEIPLNAVPCLGYRKALQEEEEEEQRQAKAAAAAESNSNKCPFAAGAINSQSNNSDDAPQVNGGDTIVSSSTNSTNNKTMSHLAAVPAAKIVTVKENTKAQSITAQELNDYCKKLFKFKNIKVLRFESWNERRRFTKNRKQIKNLQRPTLPDGTKLIKFPILVPKGEAAKNPRARKEWIMNPNGKSYICILHEYVQHALKKQPTYEFIELENAATPYAATVSINDLKYGTGYGTSKKQAKSDAARETLEILIPEMKDKITGIKTDKVATKPNYKDLSVFDDIKIEDPRVEEFCNKTTEPPPHAILLTCLQRNFGLGDVQINYKINRRKNKKNEFTMTVGKHEAKVICKNKKEGKQLASQAILQILHPHIKTWGSLLRLYGNNSIKTFKEKKLEEQEITVLQSKAAINQPNYAILDKLKVEMQKLSEKNKSVQSIGTFIPPNDVDLPTSSGSNLTNVEL
ncbi:microprocessor complex subunit DGCR8 [Episyrphus balteatus]|uniref:microprocessor complex subunit DGCR8 n=1 Tax=Episyrphus balteatus TaxID=286459 RepID=UPI0024855900|nr:microprocessor complex subunit DGCR8 [Episyrphus balteatus]